MLTKHLLSALNWEKNSGILPAIIQHAVSGDVLMLGYMNQQSLYQTIKNRRVTFWSRTRQALWTKGETSGNYLNVVKVTPDCDNDTLLILVNPVGPTCHFGTASCFSPTTQSDIGFLYQLEQLLADRKNGDPSHSYTAELYASGTRRIAQKVGEEGVETALAAQADDPQELTNEAADLIYHLMVLLQDKELSLSAVIATLKARHK